MSEQIAGQLHGQMGGQVHTQMSGQMGGQMGGQPLLEVENLAVALRTSRGIRRAVDGISFSIGQGEILGIAGESGSGKTLTALSLLGLLPMGPARRGASVLRGKSCWG